MSSEFEVKNLKNLRYFLGMEVSLYEKGIYVSQRKYTLDLLKEIGMLDYKPADNHMDSNIKLRLPKLRTIKKDSNNSWKKTHLSHSYPTWHRILSEHDQQIHE